MEAVKSCWILALLWQLGEVNFTWSWTPAEAPYALASNYLNAAQRPLWILEDELMKRQQADRQEEKENYNYGSSTMRRNGRQQGMQHLPTAITIRLRPGSSSETEPTARRVTSRHHAKLPHSKPKAQRRRQPQSLPIFDSAPGDNTLPSSSSPIFVYNGSRGELLLNTMLSARRYPMQEPVPGQVLYPPSTPMFRPKPILERFLLPGQRDLLNLTLIPFYAHEAITATTTTEESETDPPALAATETQLMTTTMTPYESQVYRGKRKRKAKKVKQYNAYRTPQEVVQWQPTLRSSPALEPPDNHRHYMVEASTEISTQEHLEEMEEEQDQLQEMQTEQIEEPSEELKETTSSTSSITSSSTSSSTSSRPSFQIVYVDESMEPPSDSLTSTTSAPQQQEQRQSSRYALKREYFAFPVYTLGKLLRHPHRQQHSTAQRKGAHDLDMDCSDCSKEEHDDADNDDDDDNTWFILNSHYKGPQRNGLNKEQTKYYTSKYIQSKSSSFARS